MKRSGSSESCEGSGDSNGHNITGSSRGGIKSGNNGCSKSSESSCGQGVHVRKRLKGHGDVHCSLFARRNRPMTKCCNHSVLHQSGTNDMCCHMVKEPACPLMSMHGSNHAHNCSIHREDDGQECSLKQQRFQHCPPKFSSCLCTGHLPCSCCNSFCHSIAFDQEIELTRGYRNQRIDLSSLKRHDKCVHCHHKRDHEGPSCQQHVIPAEIDSRSYYCKEIPNSCACMTATMKKNLVPTGVHCLFKGDHQNENTSNRIAPAAESLKTRDKSWLTLNLAKPPKPLIADFKVDDIQLGLPGNTSSGNGNPQLTQDFDLNVIAEDDPKSSIDMCAPAAPLSHNSERKTPESLQNKVNVKGTTKIETFGCGSHQIQSNIVILDDSDDECLENDLQKKNLVKEDLKQETSLSLSLDKEVPVANGSSRGDDENVERISSQSDKSETVAAVEKSDCGRTECKKGIDISIQMAAAVGHNPIIASDSRQETVASLSLGKEVAEGADVRCRVDVQVAKESSQGDDENVGSIGTQSDKSETVTALRETLAAVQNSSCGRAENKKGTNISTQISAASERNPMIGSDSCMKAVHPDLTAASPRSFGSRKKCMIDKKSLPMLDLDAINDEAHSSNASFNASATVQKAALSNMVEAKPRMWESGSVCDLCRKGPSLSLGEWYAWCCGLRLQCCRCSLGVKMKLTLSMTSKKSNRPKKTDGILWSGKVHKMCALWSSEVYEEGDRRLQGLSDAVRRGKLLVCASCKEYGATLGCRVKICRRSFHYPCADELASKLCCRMWDGVQHPVACRGHRHVPETCTNAKEKPLNLRKWRFRGFVSRQCHGSTSRTWKADQSPSLWSPTFNEHPIDNICSPQPKLVEPLPKENCMELSHTVIDLSTDSEDEDEGVQNPGIHRTGCGSGSSAVVEPRKRKDIISKEYQSNKPESGQCWLKDTSAPLYYMGTNLLCEDISCGREGVLIPCTNDVDADPAPVVNYIIKNRYLGRAKAILDSLLLDKKKCAAPTCNGCNINDIDDPNLKPSVHAALNDSQRENDTRFDWQGQTMLGRLPYDRFGRLQFGPETKDIIECNSGCPCGVYCLNKELQKGITVPLEVFKTKERGWGVRTMEQICRGKFVVEYIGEVLTHDEAYLRGIKYDLSNFSCLFSADHPDVAAEDLLVIDGFQMSNVARFINHSCDGNLRVYRVYTETTDLRFCRIGLYALHDIEIGEELSYDYSYATCKDTDKTDFSTDPTSIRCMCGASNCRQWLWTGTSR